VARLRGLPWQSAGVEAIARLLRRGVHAVLLHGPAGIGKLDLALDVAEALLCESRSEQGAACGHCAGCSLTAAGNHPDLQILRPAALAEAATDRSPAAADVAVDPEPGPASGDARAKASRAIRIEQVRDLSDWAMLTTHRAGARVIVLEPAESLTTPASNALLKVLEEPPPGTVFLVVSHRLSETLPTLRSRCVLLPQGRPPAPVALEWLRHQGLEDSQAQRRLVEAGGAPLQAMLVDREGLTPELRERLTGLLRKGAQLRPADVIASVPKEASIAGSVALFQRWGWDFLAFKLAGVVRYHPSEASAFRQLAACWPLHRACAWVGELQSARAYADHPLNAKLAIEGMLISYVRSISPPR